MKNLRNKNAPPPEQAIQSHLSTAWDKVLAVYNKLYEIENLSDVIDAGGLDGFLSAADIDSLAELNAIVLDATLGDAGDFATAAQGSLADNSVQLPFASQGEAEAGVDNTRPMTPLRVAQAIAVLAAGIQNNFAGVGVPGVLDDADAGYSAGSVWIDISADPDESYRCTDPTAGAAVWVKTTLTSDELATVGLTGNSDDLIEGVTKLLLTVAERSKLSGIEAGATADQSGAEIKSLYEGEADTNAFTDALLSKLSGIELANQAEAEAGVENTKTMTPLRVAQAIAALGSGGLSWSSANTNQAVAASTGTVFYGLVATVTATLPASPSVGDSLMIVNNDNNALDLYDVQVDAGGTNEIRQQNIVSVPTATVTQGQTALLVCYEAGATKRWHMQKWVSSLDVGTGGGGGLVVEFKNASFTAEAGKKYKVDTTSGAVVVTLPAGTDLDNIVIQDVGHYAATNNITINPNGAETIDDDTTFVIDQNEGDVDLGYISADTNWYISADGSPNIVYGPGDLVRKSFSVPLGSGGGASTDDPTWDNTTPQLIHDSHMPEWIFSASANEKLWITTVMPHDWDGDESTVDLELVHVGSNTDTGNIRWFGSLSGINRQTTFQATSAILTAYSGSTTDVQTDTLTGVAIEAAVASEALVVFIQRRGADALDTYTGTTHLKAAVIHYNAIDQLTAASEAAIAAEVAAHINFTKYRGQNLQIGTAYELVLDDAGKVVEMNNAAANTLTIPANSAVAFPVDTRIDVIQYGAGQTTIAITTDTLTGTATIGAQYQMVSLWKRAATEWVVIGGA